MALRFRPYPGLTVFTIIALVILIALGTWQYHRLQWKTEYLAGIEQAVTAEPLTSLSQIQIALDADEPIDYRRVQLSGRLTQMDKPFLVFTAVNRNVSWRVFRVFTAQGQSAFVALDIVPENRRDAVETEAKDAVLSGYIRTYRKPGWLAPKGDPADNRWYGFNPDPENQDWSDMISADPDMRFYIDTVPGAQSAEALPVRRPEVANNHFDYMLTWYGLALALLVIYGILHHRDGRLKWG